MEGCFLMKRYTIEQKFKSAAAFLVILILFPYIVSVFVNGVDPEETTNENFYIRVKASEEEEADGIAEVEWNEYLTGVLAKDVPADTEAPVDTGAADAGAEDAGSVEKMQNTSE
jgi:stage II sporulation protein D